PRPRLAHLPYAIEPVGQRYLRAMHYRPLRGVDVAPAMLAGVALPPRHRVVLRDPLALRARDAIGPPLLDEVGEALLRRAELVEEGAEGEGVHERGGLE